MIDKIGKAVVLETICVEGYESPGRMLDLDVSVYEVDRILTALYYFFDLFLLADLGHN